jgi:hypothetical protein
LLATAIPFPISKPELHADDYHGPSHYYATVTEESCVGPNVCISHSVLVTIALWGLILTIRATKSFIIILHSQYIFLKTKLKLRMCVCTFAYSSRTDKPICTNLRMLIPWEHEGNIEREKVRKSILSSSHGEGGFSSSETKHDRTPAPRQKLFVSKRRLQKRRPEPRKTVLGSSPDKDIFCSSETTQQKNGAKNGIVSARRLQGKRSQIPNLSWWRCWV